MCETSEPIVLRQKCELLHCSCNKFWPPEADLVLVCSYTGSAKALLANKDVYRHGYAPTWVELVNRVNLLNTVKK